MRDETPWCVEYDPELYAERAALEQELYNWIADPEPAKVIRTLVGPPGMGKSWLLRHVYETIKKEERQFALWIDAGELVSVTTDDFKARFVAQANANCSRLHYVLDPLLPLPAMIDDLGQRLHAACPNISPLILMDGWDLIEPSNEANKVLRDILRRFFSRWPNYFRLIVALRNKLGDHVLAKQSQPLRVWTIEPDATPQVTRLIARFAAGHPHLHNYRALMPAECTYPWNHPFINCFLLRRMAINGRLSKGDLYACAQALVQRAAQHAPGEVDPRLTCDVDDLMVAASKLPDDWEKEALKAQAGKGPDFLHVLLQHQIVVTNTSIGLSDITQYRIADGLRELLRDLAALP